MAYKIFIDANVLLDLSLKRKGYIEAEQLFIEISKGKFTGYISSSVLHIVFYILSKELSLDVTKNILLIFLEELKVIDLDKEVAVNAINSKIKDTEDALQYYAALHHNLDFFISNDKQLKKESIPNLPVINTSEFIKSFT